MCHPIALTDVRVELVPVSDGIAIEVTAKTVGRTGVEMEALTGASIAALTLYDMAKAVERGMTIENVRLVEKTGGKTGLWFRGGEAPRAKTRS
jgi:cyclic pyranopterin phosphate synthase